MGQGPKKPPELRPQQQLWLKQLEEWLFQPPWDPIDWEAILVLVMVRLADVDGVTYKVCGQSYGHKNL